MLSLEIIQRLATQDRIAFKRHSIVRMQQRRIAADELKTALLAGRLVEDYPDDYPLPSGLILGYTSSGRAIHTVVAIDIEESMLWLITVNEPTSAEWEEGFTQRRSK